jgi:hypothetical protein
VPVVFVVQHVPLLRETLTHADTEKFSHKLCTLHGDWIVLADFRCDSRLGLPVGGLIPLRAAALCATAAQTKSEEDSDER